MVMKVAYSFLLKYAINLLKPDRPRSWRSIQTTTTFFKACVASMKGATDILKEIGYTKETQTALDFPSDVNHPNLEQVSAVAAEILMAKLEIERMRRKADECSHPSPDQKYSLRRLYHQVTTLFVCTHYLWGM